MLTPMGLATVGIGAAAAAITGMVKKALNLGRQLGTLREQTGVSAEQIQIYQRAIEETNGEASSFSSAVLRLQRSIGDANQGNKEAQESFEALGLSWADLANLSPEEALKAVIGRTNESLSATDGAAVKAALLGRSYASMGGFANLTTAEIEDLTASVADSAVVMKEDGVTQVDKFDQTWRKLRDSFGKISIQVGSAIVPLLMSLMEAIMEVGKALAPIIKKVLPFLKFRFEQLVDVVKLAASILTGDFGGAWKLVKKIAFNVLDGIARIWNATLGKIPGVAKINLDKVELAMLGVQEVAEETAEATAEVQEEAFQDVSEAAIQALAAVEEEYKRHWERVQEIQLGRAQAIIDSTIALQDQERERLAAIHAQERQEYAGPLGEGPRDSVRPGSSNLG